MEAQENSIQVNVDIVVTPPSATELMRLNSEVSNVVGVDAALDEAMALEDDEEISAIEKSSKTNDVQDTTEKVNQGEEKSKDIGCAEGTQLMSVDNLSELDTEQISDSRIKETDKSEGKVIDADKIMVHEDAQADNESMLVENKDSEERSSNQLASEGVDSEGTTESQEETKTLSPSIGKEETSAAMAGEVAEEVEVEAVEGEPVSQNENQSKEDAGVSGGETIPVKPKSKPKAPARPIKVDPPTVQPSTAKQASQTEGKPGVKQCDLVSKEMMPTMKEGRVEEILQLTSQIEFQKGVTPLALLSKSRWLVKQGDATLVPQVSSMFSIFRSIRRTTYHLFLFNDTFVICKKKGSKKFVVLNYCQRNLVLIKKASSVENLQEKVRTDTKGKSKVYLTLLENHKKTKEDMVLSFAECADRDDWIKLFKTPAFSSQQEIVFELWDCPLVQVVHDFEATKDGEMTVHIGEKINVIRKNTDGFYEGERLSDQKRGFFPISATEELSSEHTRALKIRNNYNDTTF